MIRRLNNRTHRKLMIVDGRVGFVGGVGIADEWTVVTPHTRSTGAAYTGTGARRAAPSSLHGRSRTTGSRLLATC